MTKDDYEISKGDDDNEDDDNECEHGEMVNEDGECKEIEMDGWL